MNLRQEGADAEVPLVSLIVTAHNDAGVVARALASAVAQTWQNLEIVVVDDGSTDATAEVVSDFDTKGRRLKLVMKENGGLGSARHAGVMHSSGEFIAFLDADDEYALDKVEKQVAALSEREGCILFTGATVVEENGVRSARHTGGGCRVITADHVQGRLIPAANASLMVRRSDYDKIGGFDPGMRRQCEEDFLLRAYHYGMDTCLLFEPLYIVHESVGSNRWIYLGRTQYIEHLLGRAGELFDPAPQGIHGAASTYLNTVIKKFGVISMRWPWSARRELAGVFRKVSWCWPLSTRLRIMGMWLMPFRIPDRLFGFLKRLKRKLFDR